MSFDEQAKSAFTAASEATKQLLALATGVIGATFALFDDAAKTGINFGEHTYWIRAGLGILALSVVSGLMTIGAIAGQLGNSTSPSIYASGLKYFYGLQLITFGLGVCAIVAHVIF